MVALEERTVELNESQAGSDPGNTLESRPPQDKDQVGSNPGQSYVALAGPNLEPMHEDFIATLKECLKPKRANDATYHKENMLLCKQEEAGVQLNAEQADWKDDTDDESNDQELEAHYMYMK
nr:hypothetical protein [Tanacetum cinerariifolium]